MKPVKTVLLPAIFIAVVVLSSGCVNMDPAAFAKTIPMVQEFLDEHPNAEIKITHYTRLESESIIDQIREDCGKLSVEPKEYYFVNITDPSSDLVVRAWFDWERQIVECVYKEGSTTDPNNCNSLYEARCFGDHIYWFDSCGNREEKKEYCPLGCSNGRCVTGDICDVEESYKEKPRCICPEGYEMIVLYPRCSDTVTGAITGMPFAVTDEMAERAVTTESGGVKISSDFTTEFDKRCPDTKPVYRCVKRQQCRSHAQAKCYKGHVYWFDSCGHVQEKKEYCSEGCDNGFCKERRTCNQMGGYCIYSHDYDPTTPTTSASTECKSENEMCGGIAGFRCCSGLTCVYEADHPDASGICVSAYPSCRDGYYKANYWCPENGICCMPENVKCTDSDGGKDYYEKGTTCIGGGSIETHCEVDSCIHRDCVNCPDQVLEYYCDNTGSGEFGEIKHTYADCPDACIDGACVKEEGFCGWSTHYECDSDSGCIPGGCSSQVCGGINESITTICDYRDCYNAGNYGLSCGCHEGSCQWSEKECAEEGEYTSGAVSPEYQYSCCGGLEPFDPWPPEWVGGGLLCYDPEKGTPVCDAIGTKSEGWYYSGTGGLLRYEECGED